MSLALTTLTILVMFSIVIQVAYAHNFVPNDSATFLTRVYRASVELTLANSTFPSNVTLSMYHAEDAAKLMDDAYYLDEDVIDDSDFISKYNKAFNTTNSTTHALVLVNIVDQILREYRDAFDIDYDLTSMSNMIMTADNTAMSNMNSFSSAPSSHNPVNMNMTIESNITTDNN